MRRILTVAVLLAVVGLGLVLALTGCESADNAAARRALAESERVRANADAYARQVAADSAAAAERAATREAARDAAHQRALELLPYVMLIGAGVLLAGFAVWAVAFRIVAGNQAETALLWHLQRLQIEQAQRDRELWRWIAALDRRTLPEGEQQVVVWKEQR